MVRTIARVDGDLSRPLFGKKNKSGSEEKHCCSRCDITTLHSYFLDVKNVEIQLMAKNKILWE